MRFCVFCFLVFVGGIFAQQTNVELPDYAKWTSQLDHEDTYIYEGHDIQLRDQHYVLEQKTERQMLMVFYRPEDSNKAWFAIHIILDLSSREVKGFLFDRKNEDWSFGLNLSGKDLDDVATIFKSRYGLEYKVK